MGSFFDEAELQSNSTLSRQQQSLLDPLAAFARTLLSDKNPQLDSLVNALLRSGTNKAKKQSERIFEEALLGPSMRAYERDVAPRVSGAFAGIGGTLSSRRDQTLTQGRTDVIKNVQSSLASILPQIESFPLQQTLGQIQGLGAIQSQRLAPFQSALQFALQPTQTVNQSPPGPGWGLLSGLVQGTGTGLGYALGG